MENGTVQCSTVQCCTVKYSAVQYSRVQQSTVEKIQQSISNERQDEARHGMVQHDKEALVLVLTHPSAFKPLFMPSAD